MIFALNIKFLIAAGLVGQVIAKTLDVFAPPITFPKEGAVFHTGDNITVTWDTSGAPPQITNPMGIIFLRKDDLTMMNHALAANFNILDGSVPVQIPPVPPAIDYKIVLIGDSGNFSPNFTIIGPS